MPRAIWKGIVSFGLVAIPVRLYLAAQSRSVSFRLLCPRHLSPIKNKRWCPAGGEDVEWNEALRGYEYERDRLVVVTGEELENLPLPTARTIAIGGFVEAAALPGELYYQSVYFLEPDPAAGKPYALLRQALSDTGRVALAKVALREREHLAAIRPVDRVLLMNTLHWPDEVRTAEDLALPAAEVPAKELKMARSLIEAMTEPFQPERYTDETRAAVLRVVEAKLAGQEVVAAPPPPETAAIDLMAALKASVEAAEKARWAGDGAEARLG